MLKSQEDVKSKKIHFEFKISR